MQNAAGGNAAIASNRHVRFHADRRSEIAVATDSYATGEKYARSESDVSSDVTMMVNTDRSADKDVLV